VLITRLDVPVMLPFGEIDTWAILREVDLPPRFYTAGSCAGVCSKDGAWIRPTVCT
jgi:hypothetical protein